MIEKLTPYGKRAETLRNKAINRDLKFLLENPNTVRCVLSLDTSFEKE
jgi:hypothetical protein